ncbi:MAG: (E)-4-hydroxy-3-methylbut-2-enyl-diphosphate synthase [Candidatus Omnitrophica bacterium]|nr:(E)-4-hydroxy-3-methylbut-2-enyl-diphosphate synthase [Candidatus Omnitrophota bacterium]
MKRRRSIEVAVGGIGVGGSNPIRVQSMTTTTTKDLPATIEQAKALVDAGCEIVRITAPTSADAKALGAIRAQLRERGIDTPLVADIHFNPGAAMEAAGHVEKVRINPGNFADSKRFAAQEYTDAQYEEELGRIAEVFVPLVLRCKQLKRAMRLGTNHGSLSDRIMNRYGDSPQGMVESAMEYLRIAEKNDYRSIIFSMKSSNPVVMSQVNRLLVKTLDEHGAAYPLHLGVTEAGGGEDARIKSALGIGVLLAEGIGDTIRVSLTEDPVNEVPFARALARWAENRWAKDILVPAPLNPLTYNRRHAQTALYETLVIGGEELVKVGLYEGDYPHPRSAAGPNTPCEFVLREDDNTRKKFIIVQAEELLAAGREAAQKAQAAGDKRPLILVWDARRFSELNDDFLIEISVQLGGLLVDGVGDAVVVRAPQKSQIAPARLLETVYSLLQAARMRSSKTEYLACPGCGRTLFDVESTTNRIKAKSGPLKGVKIAVMGCVVNGPGEMADADFGYVGGAPGVVNLYVGKDVVERGVPAAQADERLIALIKAHGKWIDPMAVLKS